MMAVEHRDMEPVRPAHEAKTRETPRPSEPTPEPLGFGWKRDTLGPDGQAIIYQQGDAIVTRSPGSLDVEAIDSREVHRQLAYLFTFFERGGK